MVFDQQTCAYAGEGEVSSLSTGARELEGDDVGVRISKSFKVAPGVRVRLNAKSTSVTVGGRGARYTVNSKGRRTATARVPGAGVSVQHQSSSQYRTQSQASAQLPGYQAAGRGGAPSVPTRAARERLTKRGWVVILVILAMAVSIAVLIVVRHNHRQSYLPPLRENLKLAGLDSGHFTTAIAVEGMTNTFPPQQGEWGLGRVNATACVQNSDGWEIDLYGHVGSHLMSLSFDGDSTDLGADPYVGKHEIDDRANGGGTVDIYWGSLEVDATKYGASGTLLVNRDGNSGTMNITLDTGLKKPERITGSWRCA